MPRYLLVAGIDFGTSYTKVVLRDNNQPGSHAVVVTYPQMPNGLLPSILGISRLNIQSPVQATDPKAQVPYLKMLAAHVAAGESLDQAYVRIPEALDALRAKRTDLQIIRDLLSHYFARVMAATEVFIRERSRWRDFDFSSAKSDDYLIFQLAVPTGLMENAKNSEIVFREALIVAHELRRSVDSTMVDEYSSDAWSDRVDQVLADDWQALEQRYEWQCLLYPEVAAAVQGVFRAPNARDGLYTTMDVGAGTVDLNAFRRYTGQTATGRRSQARLDYYSAIVCPLGLHHLNDPQRAVKPRREAELMDELRGELRNIYMRAVHFQPNHGVQGNRTWDGAIHYLFGGGAQHTGYQRSFIAGLQHAGICKPKAYFLPDAQDVSLPQGVNFGRFVVAYGLSFFRPNLDHVRLPRELVPFRELYPPPAEKIPRQYGFNWED